MNQENNVGFVRMPVEDFNLLVKKSNSYMNKENNVVFVRMPVEDFNLLVKKSNKQEKDIQNLKENVKKLKAKRKTLYAIINKKDIKYKSLTQALNFFN